VCPNFAFALPCFIVLQRKALVKNKLGLNFAFLYMLLEDRIFPREIDKY